MSSNHQTKNEPVNDSSDLQSRPIPTIINGEASLVRMNGISYIKNDKLSVIQSHLRESSLEISVNRNKFSNSIKHKVLLFGDSTLRGCAANMKMFLNEQFKVIGFIKPGAISKWVLESAMSNIDRLSTDDFLIMCCGTNDTSGNDLSRVFKQVIDHFCKKCSAHQCNFDKYSQQT
jgi:hypothetical protein